LGGWANPHTDAEGQIDYLVEPDFCAEFYLTQIVSHHDLPVVSTFLNAAARRNLTMPGLFGVFYYRSANRRTLDALKAFLPVPIAALTREFEAGASAEEVCARTVRALVDAGARHFYISNLPVGRAHTVLNDILARAGISR
jgi:hypothetical protein